MSSTLAELRVGVLGMIGDVDELEASASSSSLFIDEFNLAREKGTLVGRFLIFDQTSANPGLMRRVVYNEKESTSVQLNRDVPNEIQVGDKAIMLNYRDQGMSKQKVDRAINDAIRACKANYLLPVSEVHESFSVYAPVIDVSSFEGGGIAAIDYRDPETLEWIELPLMDWKNSVDQWGLSVTLLGTSSVMSDLMNVRVRGYGRPGLLVNDDDKTILDYEWLVLQAAGNCHFEMARRRMDPANNERWGQYRHDQADERIGKVTPPPFGFFVPLTSGGL
jgi:hypothetical protein